MIVTTDASGVITRSFADTPKGPPIIPNQKPTTTLATYPEFPPDTVVFDVMASDTVEY